MTRSHLVTFSDESMSRSRGLCVKSAKRYGVDEEWQYEPRSILSSRHYAGNEAIFSQPEDPRRAWAWWAWKPVIIEDAMRRAAECYSGEQYVIYSDAGIEFINNVSYIIDRMDQDIFLFGNNWEHAHWCKRDVVNEVLGIGAQKGKGIFKTSTIWPDYNPCQVWDCFGKQVQASVIFFRVSGHTRKFVKEWLDWCLFEGGRLIDDSPSRLPNHPEFREHRHDQAILTTLAYREGIKLHYWPGVYLPDDRVYEKLDCYASDNYERLFRHHRRRNHEWEQVA